MLAFSVFALCCLCGAVTSTGLELPNVSGISRELTANLTVDHFFSLWIIFNNDDEVHVSDKPFTILSPRNMENETKENLLSNPDKVKETLVDHIVLGQKLRLDDISGTFHFKTLGGKIVSVQDINGTLYANSARIVNPRVDVAGGGVLVILDDYLFPNNKQILLDKEEKLEMTTDPPPVSTVTLEAAPGEGVNSTFFQNLVDLLSFFKNGVRVFQHFLSRSNVSHLLKNDEEYTVLIPTDHAFQRWHPIDWGFYPFSVPEFTENIIINHFISENLRQDNIKDGQIVKTLGGREIVFTRNLFFLSANGAPIVRGDTPIHHGNLMFISEVLFVSEAEVQKLHQLNKDKETPPLLAFPWFGAQFLSHAFLALERQRKFSHVTRFLNAADLSPYVSGKGYTFFVPVDAAFEDLGLAQVQDGYFATGDTFNILLNHFVKGRLYEKDLKNERQLVTLGNKTISIKREAGEIHVNDAKIIESEIFVYNLGTMFYIDKVLFAEKSALPPVRTEVTLCDNSATTQSATVHQTDVEKIPDELSEDLGKLPDVLLEEGDTSKTEVTDTATATATATVTARVTATVPEVTPATEPTTPDPGTDTGSSGDNKLTTPSHQKELLTTVTYKVE